VWTLAFMMLIWLVAVPAMMVGAARATRHRAESAADLAALAASAHAAEGAGAACRRASAVARGGGGRLSACELHGRVADVAVVVTLRGPVPGRLAARARAGPAEQGP
jgi:secretion/DNA translocation related TadE-like protein